MTTSNVCRLSRWSAVLTLAVVASCGGTKSSSPTVDGLTGFEQRAPGSIGAQVAVYELVANEMQRFRLGLVAEGGRLISFGKITLEFALSTPSGAVRLEER